MKTNLLVLGLISLCLMACTDKQIVTEVQIVKLTPPVITACEKMTIRDCQPRTNGELYECVLVISKNLSLCAAQTDALIKWQNGGVSND